VESPPRRPAVVLQHSFINVGEKIKKEEPTAVFQSICNQWMLERGFTSSDSGKSTQGYTSASVTAQSSGKPPRAGKRKREFISRDNLEGEDDDDDDNPEEDRKPKDRKVPDPISRFACPFNKRSQDTSVFRSCKGLGWESISRVK